MKLHSRQIGSGQPVVLLHGLLASSHYWTTVTDALDTTKYQVLSIDMLGFGQSPKPKTGYTIENYTKLIMQTVQDSGIKPPFILVGHSMGSLVASYIAEQHPDMVKRLVLVGPPFYESSEQAQHYIESDSKYTKLFKIPFLARTSCWLMCHLSAPLNVITPWVSRTMPKKVTQDALRHTWYSYSKTLEHIIYHQDYLKKSGFTVPTRILYGSTDRLIVMDNIKNFSNSALIKKLDAGHQIPLTHPETVVEAITAS